MNTPWGRSQGALERLPLGCAWVSTASHGGLFVPSSVRDVVPETARAVAIRTEAGDWYEEDCAYAVAYLALPPEVERESSRWAIAQGYKPADEAARRAEYVETVAAWYGPDVLRALGVRDLAPYEARLRFWAENAERWGRKGRVAA